MAVNSENYTEILPLAERIWQVTYGPIISQDQIKYMLPMMYSQERIFKEISEDYQWELVLENNIILGYLDYRLMEDNRVFLSKIYLDPDKQKKGFGYLMFQRVIEYAKSKKASAVYLTVNKNNERAISFYERNGLQCIESKTFDIGNGYVMDDYVYQINI